MIATRDFKSVEEMQSYYSGMKKRLYQAPPAVVRLPPPIPVVRKDLAESVNLKADHDAHVQLRRAYVDITSGVMGRGGRILQQVAHRYGILPNDITSRSKKPLVVLARNEAAWLMRTELKWSLPMIARTINRDHSTTMHACRRHAQRMAGDDFDTVTYRLKSGAHESLEIHQIATVLRLSRGGMLDEQIAAELGLRPMQVRFAHSRYNVCRVRP